MDTIHNWDTWIGTDEAGKGDYFGPLVAAGVYVDAECCETLSEFGIVDGKKLSNRRVRHLAEVMRSRYEEHIVVVEKMPAAYNSLYDDLQRRGQNLNHLLASLHAEAIHTLAVRVGVKHVLVDRFSKNDLITQELIRCTRRGGNTTLTACNSRSTSRWNFQTYRSGDGNNTGAKSRTGHRRCRGIYYCS